MHSWVIAMCHHLVNTPYMEFRAQENRSTAHGLFEPLKEQR